MQPEVASEVTKLNTDAPSLDFAQLFKEYHPRVYTYLRYRVNSLEDAEDLIGLVFEKAYTNRDKFDATKGDFAAWLFRIAHNTLANYYRRETSRSTWESGQELPDDLTMAAASPETEVIRQESIAQLLRGLSQLSERDQEVISLKFAGRLRNREIGEIMDMKEKTVSVVLLRAMRRLQKEVKAEEPR